MVHRNVGFLEAPKIVEKLSQSWRSKPAFSSVAESLRGYVERNMKNPPLLKLREDERSRITQRQVKAAIKPRAIRLNGNQGEGNGK
jgi:hypothetical protein